MGAWCIRSVSSSAMVRCLSSAQALLGRVYLHSSPFLTLSLCPFFSCLKHHGFLVVGSYSGSVNGHEDIIDEDQATSTSIDHNIRASRWWHWEWVTLTLVQELLACTTNGAGEWCIIGRYIKTYTCL
jgi:hypothetical protein